MRIETTDQWSLPRLGGAVQSFKGRRGSSQAPPLIDSDTVFMARAESWSMRAGLKQDEEEEEEVEQPSHRWKSAGLDGHWTGGARSEKRHPPATRSRTPD